LAFGKTDAELLFPRVLNFDSKLSLLFQVRQLRRIPYIEFYLEWFKISRKKMDIEILETQDADFPVVQNLIRFYIYDMSDMMG